jgi:hypothetical protein
MRSAVLLLTAAAGLFGSAQAISAKSYTTWDCCKPACAWSSNARGAQGLAKVCAVDNSPISNNQGNSRPSGCESNSTQAAYLCNDYSPKVGDDNLAYGFAAMPGNNCCKCYQIFWTSGGANGKSMVVQVINQATGGEDGKGNGDVQNQDMVILTPGGGTGPYEQGCRKQWGAAWGKQNGGFDDRSGCELLPFQLQEGCYWRFNWARGDINGWNINYNQVQCPSRLTAISGCSA